MSQVEINTNTEFSAVLDVAIKAARTGGAIILEGAARRASLHVEHKRLNDLVSEVDRLSEAAIVSVIQATFPDHRIVAEEGGGNSSNSKYCWIIDPLDGTTNFLHGFDHFAVSIGVQYEGQLVVGVVFDPIRDHLFQAVRGQGATMNGRPIQVARRATLEEALVSTGLPYPKAEDASRYFAILDKVWRGCRNVRRPGVASLDLAYVAAGYLDAFFEFALLPWDIAAGALLVEEAGGRISDPHGDETYLSHGYVVAANPQIHREILSTIEQAVGVSPWYLQE